MFSLPPGELFSRYFLNLSAVRQQRLKKCCLGKMPVSHVIGMKKKYCEKNEKKEQSQSGKSGEKNNEIIKSDEKAM